MGVLGLVIVAGCSAQQRAAPEHAANLPAARPTARTAPPPAEAVTGKVAITLDDLGASEDSSEPAISAEILAALKAVHAPVAVFVNCRSLKSATLRLWQDAGATFGNHTATHLSLDEAGADDTWWRDVQSCDARLTSELHERVAFFRYPFLRYGKTPATRAAAAQELATLGYSIAHVTAATSEWLLAGYYEQALKRGDAALVDDLVAAYVQHMLDSLQTARELAIEKTGHDVAQITLAHVNRLAAEHLGDVLAALRAGGWQFVSLKEALADPVYALPDVYTGGCGCSWLARIEPALTRNDPYPFGDYEDQIRARFEKRALASP